MLIEEVRYRYYLGGGSLGDNLNQTVICVNCSKELSISKKFCTNCGTKIENKPEISNSYNHVEELGMHNEPTGSTTMHGVDETFDSFKNQVKD